MTAIDAPAGCDRRAPRHVALIMDGNGRWATSRGLPRWAGHAAGRDRVMESVDAALELGVEVLSVYAFSTENWRRSAEEVGAILRIIELFVRDQRAEFERREVRFVWRGSPAGLPAGLVEALREVERATAGCTRMVYCACINYGGRAEIALAARALAAEALAGRLDVDAIDEHALSRQLHDDEVPDVDLVVRCGGDQRLSNFLLWQVAYAEMVTPQELWPDFDRACLRSAVAQFGARERRFGGVAQAAQP